MSCFQAAMNSVPLSLMNFTEPSQTMSQKKSTPYLVSQLFYSSNRTIWFACYFRSPGCSLGFIFLLAVFSENTGFFVQPVENVFRHFLRQRGSSGQSSTPFAVAQAKLNSQSGFHSYVILDDSWLSFRYQMPMWLWKKFPRPKSIGDSR